MSEPDHVASARIAYDHSAQQFVEAVGAVVSSEFEADLDRRVLEDFSDLVGGGRPGPIADVGCGPGRIAAFLADRGHLVSGFDLSANMVAAARVAHPALHFEVGSLTELPVASASLAGVVCWYSIIATPLAELDAVWTELDRTLRPGAELLVAFQAGANETVERTGAYGSATTLTLHRHDADEVSASLRAAGFEVHTDLRRPPELEHETTGQAFLVARAAPRPESTDDASRRRRSTRPNEAQEAS